MSDPASPGAARSGDERASRLTVSVEVERDPCQAAPEPRPLEVSADATVSLPPEAERPQFSRYRAGELQGRGGMGEVWLCRDEVIGREVGLKRMIRDDPIARERFVAEAQITGQLEHPGIVPVHDVGLDDNGRPFYVMKFVRGQTLKCVIDEFHAGGRSPTPVERLRLLEIFIDLARAVAYAHSRGVIHRDLKPENVMIGPYGETVVLDWGLAKLRTGTDLAPPPAMALSPRLSGGRSGGDTQEGSIFGSPLYMSPEMAQGLTNKVDERTDIYLLGATLYEILTGRPPRSGKSRDEILELARTASPVPPRRLAPGVPRPLEAVCVKAMSYRRESRYASAMDLGRDVQAFIAGEAVLALPEGPVRRAARWARRHRRGLARVAAVTAFGAVVWAGAATWREAAALRRSDQARRATQEFVALAEEARFYAASTDPVDERAPYFDARRGLDALTEATRAAAAWGDDLAGYPLVEQREPIKENLYELHLMRARLALNDDRLPGAADVAAEALERAAGLRAIGTRGLHRLRAEVQRRRGDATGAAKAMAAAEDAGTPVTANDLFLDAEVIRTGSESQVGADVVGGTGRPDVDARAMRLRDAMALYEAALRLKPDHFWSRYQLGRCYLAMGRATNAADVFGACVALRPASPWARGAQGLALALAGRAADADADFAQALKLAPDFGPARLNRGVAYLIAGRKRAAAAEFDGILAGRSRKASPEAAYYRGQLHLEAGDLRAAIACLERAASERTDFPAAHVLLAKAQFLRGDDTAAMRAIDSAVGRDGAATPERRGVLLRRVAANLSNRAAQARAAGLALEQLRAAVLKGGSERACLETGAALEMLGRSPEALEAYSQGAGWYPGSATLRVSRGWCLSGMGRHREAELDFDRAVQLSPQLAEALSGRAFARAKLRRIGDAERDSTVALVAGGADYLVLHNVACVYAELSVARPQSEAADQDVAVSLLKRAVALWRAAGEGPDEVKLIQDESAFPRSMRQRKDFVELLAGAREAQVLPESTPGRETTR